MLAGGCRVAERGGDGIGRPGRLRPCCAWLPGDPPNDLLCSSCLAIGTCCTRIVLPHSCCSPPTRDTPDPLRPPLAPSDQHFSCLQVQTRGFVPAALPDSRCYGPGAPSSSSSVLGGLAAAPPLSSAAESVQGLAEQLTQASGSLMSGVDVEGAVRGMSEAGSSLAGAAQSQLQVQSCGLTEV